MEIQEAELDNGLKLVVVPDHRSSVITNSIWYKVGAVDEPDGATGMSHMLEHLMFKGTEKYPGGTMEKLIQRNGGQQNAFTSYEMTAYHQTISADKLPLMLEVEADRMQGIVLNNKVFLPERQVVSEERKWRIESQPVPGFYERLQRARYQVSPFGRAVIGSRQDIEAYDLPRIIDWYKAHYAPNNATLMVVGDVEMAGVLPLAQKYFGRLKPHKVPARKLAAEPPRQGETRLVEVHPEVQVPVFARWYHAPSAFAGLDGGKVDLREAVGLWALAEIVGGSDSARLYRELVMKRQIANAASASYDPVSGVETDLGVSVSPRLEVPLDKIMAAVDEVVDDLKKNGVTEAELKRAKTNLLADDAYARDDADNIMYRLGSWLMAGGEVSNFEAWQPVLRNLTLNDVNAMARKYLNNNTSTLGILVGKKSQLGNLRPEYPPALETMQAAARKAAKQKAAAPSEDMLRKFR